LTSCRGRAVRLAGRTRPGCRSCHGRRHQAARARRRCAALRRRQDHRGQRPGRHGPAWCRLRDRRARRHRHRDRRGRRTASAACCSDSAAGRLAAVRPPGRGRWNRQVLAGPSGAGRPASGRRSLQALLAGRQPGPERCPGARRFQPSPAGRAVPRERPTPYPTQSG